MQVDGVELVREAPIDEAPKSRLVSPMHFFRIEKLNDVLLPSQSMLGGSR
jgi:hypothetical protein